MQTQQLPGGGRGHVRVARLRVQPRGVGGRRLPAPHPAPAPQTPALQPQYGGYILDNMVGCKQEGSMDGAPFRIKITETDGRILVFTG